MENNITSEEERKRDFVMYADFGLIILAFATVAFIISALTTTF